ncbi:hypothetical protein FQN54_000465 [Arachnomyces sp. PD_36]|nr:hypothetical protein FQN54_000465 [Arachnomyces sp. PD_36]
MFNRAVRRIPAFDTAITPRAPTTTSPSRYLSQRTRPLPQSKYGRSQIRQFTHSPPRTQEIPSGQWERFKYNYRIASKDILRKSPIAFPVALISVIGVALFGSYLVYFQFTVVEPQYHKFPPEVAKPLRRAVYYTDIKPNPSKAMSEYKQALIVANQMGLHPCSDQVLGIKVNITMMLEKSGQIRSAIEVLERVKKETLAWVAEDRKKKLLRDSERAREKKTKTVGGDPEEAAREEERRREEERNEDRLQNKTLKRVIGMGLKLGELYAMEDIQDHTKAEASLTSAVELCVQEMRRRQRLGLPVGGDGDDEWQNLSEMASSLDQLATLYTNKNKHDLAAPLFLQALAMIKEYEGNTTSCKQVVLLNNVATAMAGQAQNPTPATAVSNNPLPRDQVIDSARQWAQKAIDVAEHIQPPIRNEECDISCAVATYNLGELAEMQNDFEGARKRYAEARNLAKGIGFEDGVGRADEALKRLDKRT